MENHIHCLVHNSDNIWKTIHCFLSVQWEHTENHIHCVVKQQQQHMKIHPLLIKYSVTTRRKQHLLFFERQQWQLWKNASTTWWKIWKSIHCSLNELCKHMKNYIHWSWKDSGDNMWQTTSSAWWNSSDNTWKSIHPLLTKCALTTHGKQHPLFFERDPW